MKKFPILLIFLIASTVTAYATDYTLKSVTYPINVNGVNLTVEPLNYNGTTYLPIRAISEAVGVPIEWNNATRSVEITTLDVDKLKESCVMIYAYNEKAGMQGSGVYVDYDQVLTANHVVDGKPNVKTSDGDILTIEDTDLKTDSAVLESSEEVKPVKIGDSDEVKVGDKVILITSPKGAENTVTYATVQELNSIGTLIMIWGDANHGSSGGSVFNTKGELIGVLKSGGEKLLFIIPINDIRKAL